MGSTFERNFSVYHEFDWSQANHHQNIINVKRQCGACGNVGDTKNHEEFTG